jgi:hypothetical protein
VLTTRLPRDPECYDLLVRPTRAKLWTIACAAAFTGCSLLVHLDDPTGASGPDGGGVDATFPGEDGDSASGTPPSEDGGNADATSDAAHPAGDGAPPPDPCATLDAGAFCAYAGGCQCTYCQNGACSSTKACPEAFNWEAGNPLARCCSGLAVLTDTNENCGVCGVHCATAGVTSPQDCALLDGHYQCVNCAANTECWSGCCAIDTTPYHCAESDCNTGSCVAGLCPAPSACVSSTGAPNYCSYE